MGSKNPQIRVEFRPTENIEKKITAKINGRQEKH